MIEEANYCKKLSRNTVKKNLNIKNEKKLRKPDKSWICGKSYSGGDVKVRDHGRIIGKLWGSAHGYYYNQA